MTLNMIHETGTQFDGLAASHLCPARRVRPRRVSSMPLLLAGMLALAACSANDEAGDAHHSDAASVDARAGDPSDDGTDTADGLSDTDAEDSIGDGAAGPCSEPCRSGQVCCVDQHGHFPRCVDGSFCPPPLQPPPDS